MAALNLTAKGITAFVPAGKNYQLAIEFFLELGFELQWRSEELSSFSKDNCRFFLQNFAHEEMQKNFMMSLEVENLDDWWQMIEAAKLTEKYPGVKIKAPEVYPWGIREVHLIDPAGVLWHIS